MQTLDMTFIRYLNLFDKITRVRCKNCFTYNNFLIFAVPSAFISKAIGKEGRNVKRMSQMIHKKIKIVALPENIEESEKFITAVVAPYKFRKLEVVGDELVLDSSKQDKAGLIGRNKVRFLELKKIVEDIFGKKLRIG